MSSSSFASDKVFRDPINFPYGFARSGEFTIAQARLIEQHGYAYKALASGERSPVNKQETAFVSFCQGNKPAIDVHERTWQRYLDKVQRSRMVYTLAKGASAADSLVTSADISL